MYLSSYHSFSVPSLFLDTFCSFPLFLRICFVPAVSLVFAQFPVQQKQKFRVTNPAVVFLFQLISISGHLTVIFLAPSFLFSSSFFPSFILRFLIAFLCTKISIQKHTSDLFLDISFVSLTSIHLFIYFILRFINLLCTKNMNSETYIK